MTDAGGWHGIWSARGLAARLLWPLSLLYGAVLALRLWLYRTGWLRRVKLPVPVLVVGNVIVGGAGKTPVTIELALQLQSRGWRVGILSRGYGRTSEAITLVSPHSDPAQVGDEPVLMHSRTGLPVMVGRDRVQAAHALLQAHPEVNLLICDDGMQHLRLWHDAALCVFDPRRTANGWLLPAGPLREPWPLKLSAPHVWSLSSEDPPWSGAWPVVRTLSDQARNGHGQSVHLSELPHPIHALAGIAQPQRFFTALRHAGVNLEQTRALPDHAPLNDWQPDTDGTWLCTEKDAVKLWGHLPQVWAVPLLVTLPPDLIAQIDQALRPHYH
jgi:tetraacyldisaccharide 4'-kinase